MAEPQLSKAALLRTQKYKMTSRDYKRIQRLIKEVIGVDLNDHKKNMVYTRLHKRLKILGLNNFEDYIAHLRHSDDEMAEFVNAVTTNVTSFFRENHHFEHLAQTVVPELIERKLKAGSRQIKIWSAGCSTGQEPYSIAISLLEAIPNPSSWNIEITATDINTEVLAVAKTGVYDSASVDGVDFKILRQYFEKGIGTNEGKVRVRPNLKKLIHFKPLNLMESWHFKDRFDVIFCRNVLIYFDNKTQAKIVERYCDRLAERGVLYIGHSETLVDTHHLFQPEGKNTYRKTSQGAL